ncbi:hypothetical protein B0H19DRAFT_924260 [Mycena capillaripes]|nr:hypothetical protein B0H19DRAFT_924260 [Mycena capillaripes]
MLKLSALHCAITLLFIGVPGALAAGERCCFDGTPGICTTDTNCDSFGGFTLTGLCPGPTTNRCCVVLECNPPNVGSTCVWVRRLPRGSVVGKCPGGNNFKCCTSGVQTC